MHQLAKDHWRKEKATDKSTMISKLKETYKVTSLEDINMCRLQGKIIVEGHMTDSYPLHLTSTNNMQELEIDNDDEDKEDDNLDSGCLVGDFESELDNETLLKVDSIASSANVHIESSQSMSFGVERSRDIGIQRNAARYPHNDLSGLRLGDLFSDGEESVQSLNNHLETFSFQHEIELSEDDASPVFELSSILSEAHAVLTDNSYNTHDATYSHLHINAEEGFGFHEHVEYNLETVQDMFEKQSFVLNSDLNPISVEMDHREENEI